MVLHIELGMIVEQFSSRGFATDQALSARV